jgi:hypothetical protein
LEYNNWRDLIVNLNLMVSKYFFTLNNDLE